VFSGDSADSNVGGRGGEVIVTLYRHSIGFSPVSPATAVELIVVVMRLAER
jgi:hypothetical protein